MCAVFEEGVASFVKSLGDNDASTKLADQEGGHPTKKEKPKKRKYVRATTKKHDQGGQKQEVHEDTVPLDKAALVEDTYSDEDTVQLRKRKYVDKEHQVHEDAASKDKITEKLCSEDIFSVTATEDNLVEELGKQKNDEQLDTKELAATIGQPSVLCDVTPDALKQLQSYGTWSQSTSSNNIQHKDDSVDPSANTTPLQFQGKVCEGSIISSDMKRTSSSKRKKAVSFVLQAEHNHEENHKADATAAADCSNAVPPEVAVQSSPNSRRPITRSMSPLKASVSKEGSPKLSKQSNSFASKVADSPRRLTRFAASQSRENDRDDDMPVE
jgi:hypothetical protein